MTETISEIQKRKNLFAFWICLLVGLFGIAASLYFFVNDWQAVIAAEYAANEPGEATIVTYIFPMLTDLEVLAGLGMVVAA